LIVTTIIVTRITKLPENARQFGRNVALQGQYRSTQALSSAHRAIRYRGASRAWRRNGAVFGRRPNFSFYLYI